MWVYIPVKFPVEAKKSVSESLEVGIIVVVSDLMWVLGTELRRSARGGGVLNC